MPRDDREQNFDKALARSLRSSNAAPGDDCFDAEVLAAYHERLLDPEEMAQRKAHIASCERCMEIVAQLEATDAIPVEADRDLLLDQIVLDIPESTPAGAVTESAPMTAESAPLNETTPIDISPSEASPIELPPIEDHIAPDPEIVHDPELVPAFSAAPSVDLHQVAPPVLVTPAAKLVPSSATITFRSPREDRPKMVRYVAIAGALAAGLIFWLVYRDHSNSFDLAQNRPASKLEMPPESPASAKPSENRAESSSSSEPGDATSQGITPQNSVAHSPAQPQPAPSKTPTDTVANALDDAKKAVDTAKALEQKSRKDAAGQAPVFVPSRRDESAAGALYSARALPPAGRSVSPRKFETANGSSADNGRTGAITQSTANSSSGIPATPPPARTKMNPGVINEAVTLDSAAPALLQKSASAAPEESQPRRATSHIIATLNPLSVPAPGGATIWRIGQAGMIQRSSNSGATWSIQPSGIVTDLIAGSAYSDQICWLVGRNGTILRTTNGGATWQKIDSPSNDDLLAVFSINADIATITDAAGRAFETTSAGARWARTRIQQ